MCGIAGFYAPQTQLSSVVEDMIGLIDHRGPDGSGIACFTLEGSVAHLDTTKAEHCNVGLGHRRLSIIDLSEDGHQPMKSQDDRYWITYNGEIYNYIELRTELEEIGYDFVSRTDTEVILAAYAEWGAECQHKFNGMWAFVVYDTHEKSFFISRDRFGIKPLYYWVSPDGVFYFGSEIKQFTALPSWKAELNNQRAYDFLVWGVTDHTDETLFKGVFQLRPGYCCIFNLKTVSLDPQKRLAVTQWYKIPHDCTDDSFENASSRFRDLLKKSVKLRLRSDVPVGSCLSGGLDSSSIVCLMNNILQAHADKQLQKTFSACSSEDSVDERKWVEHVVQHTAVDAHYTYPDFNQLFECLSKITWHQDEPFGSTSIFAQWEVFSLAAENNVTVMLDGQGADEQLAGYHAFFGARLADAFKKLRFLSCINEARAIHNEHGHSWGWIIGQTSVNILPAPIKGLLRKWTKRSHPIPSWLNTDMLNINAINPHDKNTSGVQSLSRAQMTSTNLQMLLHWEDRDSMAHSIESRVPFLDYRLVEYVMSLPSEYKIKGSITKRVLRSAMRTILPDVITERVDKIGFATPEEIWIKKDAAQLFREKIKNAVKSSGGIITEDAIKLFDDVVADKRPFSFVIWRIISFVEWLDVFDVNTGVSE